MASTAPKRHAVTLLPEASGDGEVTRPSRPNVLFLGSMYAGHRTRFLNLREHARVDNRIRPTFRTVTGWQESGMIEHLPLLPARLKGRLRAASEAAAVARLPRPDVIWTSCREELTPFAWAQVRPMRRPMALEFDATDLQLEGMSEQYFARTAKSGWQERVARLEDRVIRRGVDLFIAWSNWAAEGLQSEGVAGERIRVLPPGIDLSVWQPVPKDSNDRPLRVLFVGGDFSRKGGDLLLEAARQLTGEIEVVLVTFGEARDLPPNARIERAEPNSPELRAWYDWADIFVLPTRADCFGIATIEAMAAGLPTIVTDVGGARDIVVEGETGWLVEPSVQSLLSALQTAIETRSQLPTLGVRGRHRAEERFDGRRNDRELVDLLLELAGRGRDREPS